MVLTNMSDAHVPRDPFSTGMFPLCTATHDVGVRWLFDLSTLLLLMNCRPGDRVLDLGAGSGFSSEMAARLGYDVVALDPDRDALGHNRLRLTYDRPRIEGNVQVLQGVAERLPFADTTFDGVLGMNVIHHVGDLPSCVAELARVLRPGCRAAFSEPGLDHLERAQTQRAVRELGENDRAFDVVEFLQLARVNGFSQALLPATLHPPLRLVPVEELNLFASGEHPSMHLTERGVLEELQRHHPFALLVREGKRTPTSRFPGRLDGELHVDGVPAVIMRGGTFSAIARAINTGDTLWLSRPHRVGGYVTIGCKLLAEDGRLITDRLLRHFLPCDVAPGGAQTVPLQITLPADVAPGRYRLQFDLIDELVCWFSDLTTGSPPGNVVVVQ